MFFYDLKFIQTGVFVTCNNVVLQRKPFALSYFSVGQMRALSQMDGFLWRTTVTINDKRVGIIRK